MMELIPRRWGAGRCVEHAEMCYVYCLKLAALWAAVNDDKDVLCLLNIKGVNVNAFLAHVKRLSRAHR